MATKRKQLKYRPRTDLLLNVVNYLESIGLQVYGPCMDLEDGQGFYGNMDFNSKDVITFPDA